MDRLIQDVLRFSRLGRRSIRLRTIPLDLLLSGLIEDLVDRLDDSGGSIDLQGELPGVWGDESLLVQIFTNLLENALTYHHAGSPPRVVVRWRGESEHVVVSVSDQGIGIAEQYRVQIFNLFERLHSDAAYPGTGVGLAIVKTSVARLSGELWVELSEGGGSTFHVRLPRDPSEKGTRP